MVTIVDNILGLHQRSFESAFTEKWFPNPPWSVVYHDANTSNSKSLSLETIRGKMTLVCRGGRRSPLSCFMRLLVCPDREEKLSKTLGL